MALRVGFEPTHGLGFRPPDRLAICSLDQTWVSQLMECQCGFEPQFSGAFSTAYVHSRWFLSAPLPVGILTHFCAVFPAVIHSIFFLPSKKSVSKETLERMKGIEPSQPAWKAGILPLNHIRIKYFGWHRSMG